MISTATIRSNNIKESKEKQNRERLLAGPGSEFSLSNPDFDLELDYYDYNVTNAGAAPGSYLGMDPAYLVWIPPLDERVPMHEESDESETDVGDDEDDEDDDDEDEPQYEEILPTFSHINPGSNTETPNDEAPRLPPLNGSSSGFKDSENDEENTRNIHNLELNKIHAVNTFQNESLPKLVCGTSRLSTLKIVPAGDRSTADSIPMQDLYMGKNVYNQRYITANVKSTLNRQSYRDDKDTDTEKETSVIKSPTNVNTDREYYELDDIQFADEEDDAEDEEDDDEITNALAAQKDNRGKMLVQQTQQGDRYVRSITLSSTTSNK